MDREDWLAMARWRFPIGAMVRCRCQSCEARGLAWYVDGWEFEDNLIRVVGRRDLVGVVPNSDPGDEGYNWIPVGRFDGSNPVARVVPEEQ